MEDFIGRYNCPTEICDGLIQHFNDNKEQQKDGVTGSFNSSLVNKEFKESNDFTFHLHDSLWHSNSAIQSYNKHLFECVENYCKKYTMLDRVNPFTLTEVTNIQSYPISGGYKVEHCERGGSFDKTIKRILVFMTYLNDLSDGGTNFKYQGITEKAVKGKTLIFPTDWTHTHSGQISHTKEKIIITGWLSHAWD